MIRLLTLSETPQASHSVSKKAKPLVALLGLGLVLTFVIPQVIDGLANRGSGRNEVTPSLRTGVSYLGDQRLPGRQGNRFSDEVSPVYSRARRRDYPADSENQ